MQAVKLTNRAFTNFINKIKKEPSQEIIKQLTEFQSKIILFLGTQFEKEIKRMEESVTQKINDMEAKKEVKAVKTTSVVKSKKGKATETKKPLNAWNLFQKDQALQAQQKGKKSDKKVVSNKWKKLSKKDKEFWESEAQKIKKRYEKETKNLNSDDECDDECDDVEEDSDDDEEDNEDNDEEDSDDSDCEDIETVFQNKKTRRPIQC